MSVIYANRKNIKMIETIRIKHGSAKVGQTNSRQSGNFIERICLYSTQDDIGHPDRALKQITTVEDLVTEFNKISNKIN